VLSFEEQPPAARARASGITHNTMREHFMDIPPSTAPV
jgi:hypothetical protein